MWSPNASPAFSPAGSIVASESCLQRTRGTVKLDPAFVLYWRLAQTSIHRLETPLGWASADPFAFVMLMNTSRCTARHSGACRCTPIDFAYPRGSRFQPKQGSDSSRRARDTTATMLHFTHFWRHRGESAMKHCQLYNCTCKKCVYMNISDKNWPNNVEFRSNFHRYAPSTAGSQEIILTVELSNPKSTRATDLMLLLCPLVLAQDGGTRSRQKCLHRDFSATVLFWVIMLGWGDLCYQTRFLVAVVTADNV